MKLSSSDFPSGSEAFPESLDATLSITWTKSKQLEVHSMIPDGISIGTGPYGRCLIATKPFQKGSFLYRGYAVIASLQPPSDGAADVAVAANSKGEVTESDDVGDVSATETPASYSPFDRKKNNAYQLHVYNKSDGKWVQSFVLNETHSVLDFVKPGEGLRQFYGFDAFINHSCDPNIISPLVGRKPDSLCFDTIALKDIKVGDEITCDYALFEYDCHETLVCGCKAPNCRGSMRGFKHLDLDEKIRLLAQCEEEIVELFFRDNPNISLLESHLPNGIALISNTSDDNAKCLVASCKFEEGDVIFTNQATIFTHKEMDSKMHILKVNGTYTLLDNNKHFIHRPEYAEMVGFDTFMDHSCNPNAHRMYQHKASYTVYAARAIWPGEKILCDYGELGNQAMGIPNLISSEIAFLCQSGSDQRRGLIEA